MRRIIMRRLILSLLLVLVVAANGYATTGNGSFTSQTVRANVLKILTISVTPPTVDFGTLTPGQACQENSSTFVTVSSNATWSLIAYTDVIHQDGRLALDTFSPGGVLTKMGNPLLYRGGQIATFTQIKFDNVPFIWLLQAPTIFPPFSRTTQITYRLCSQVTDLGDSGYQIPVYFRASHP